MSLRYGIFYDASLYELVSEMVEAESIKPARFPEPSAPIVDENFSHHPGVVFLPKMSQLPGPVDPTTLIKLEKNNIQDVQCLTKLYSTLLQHSVGDYIGWKLEVSASDSASSSSE